MLGNSWYKKEKPLLGLTGMGGGAGGYLVGAGAAPMDPREHFDVRSGLTAPFTVNDINFEADLIVGKSTSNAEYWIWADSVRGFDNVLKSNTDGGEASGDAYTSVGSSGYSSDSNWFSSGRTYTTWAWDAGSSTVTNTDGTITSSVRANPSAGFSIVSATSPGAPAAIVDTYGHGLNAQPKMVIIKNRDVVDNWWVHMPDQMTDRQYLFLNSNTGLATAGDTFFTTSSSTIGIKRSAVFSAVSEDAICYCWTEIPGYSKFGSYLGNNSADGSFVYCGFKPRWVMVKSTAANSGNWWIWDSEREPTNAITLPLYANTDAAETSSGTGAHDLLSNGFKFRGNGGAYNGANTYIFCAWAESPFKYSNAR